MLGSRFSQPFVELSDFDYQHIENGHDDEGSKAAHYAHKDETHGQWPRIRDIDTHNNLETCVEDADYNFIAISNRKSEVKNQEVSPDICLCL